MKPRDANSKTNISELHQDSHVSGDYHIVVDGYGVYLAEMRGNQVIEAVIAIPKEHFDKLIDFYNADQEAELGGG